MTTVNGFYDVRLLNSFNFLPALFCYQHLKKNKKYYRVLLNNYNKMYECCTQALTKKNPCNSIRDLFKK